MGFQEFVSTTASIVAIVGGVLGIISALSKEPVFTRFWQRRATSQTPPVAQPSSALSKPVVKATPSSGAQKQPPQSLPTNRLKLGLIYGVISGVLSMLILIGAPALSRLTSSNTFTIVVMISALLILSIVAGLLPSRASGSVISAIVAGGILALFIWLIFAALTSTADLNTRLVGFLVYSVPSFITSMLSGLVGRHQYKRLQVPTPNEYTLATKKSPSGIGAQQLQPPPLAQQVPVQGICPNCHATNARGARFCNQCGTKL